MASTFWIGTSGWQYDSWKGRLYPRDLPTSAWLRYFSARFPTVEINNSFYRLPSEDAFDRWRRESSPDFLFAVKASRFLTHIKRLKDPADPVALFWSRATKLQEKLGPVLFQLPPRFKADLDRLSTFLDVLPAGMRTAMEFRDPSWLIDPVYEMLDRRGVALVLAHTPGTRAQPIMTGDWSYVRFHKGQRILPGYRTRTLRAWAQMLVELPANDVYVYFNNDTDGAALRDAVRFADIVGGLGARVPQAA